MDKTAHILILDDEPQIRKLVERSLSRGNFEIEMASSYAEATDLLTKQDFDLIIIDLLLPDGDGLELTKLIHAQNKCRVIILSGLSTPSERILGLELGADDYIAKPFDPGELLARVRTVLRRAPTMHNSETVKQNARVIEFDNWVLSIDERELVHSENGPIDLTSSEFDLLALFAKNKGQILSRDKIVDEIYGDNPPALDRSIDLKIGRLRKKLDSENPKSSLIKTIRNSGYMLVNC